MRSKRLIHAQPPCGSMVIVLLLSMVLSTNSFAQTVSFDGNRVPLDTALASVSTQTLKGYIFVSGRDEKERLVTLHLHNVPLGRMLKSLLGPQGLTFSITDNLIYVYKDSTRWVRYTGLVVNEAKEPLNLATVEVVKKGTATVTNEKGLFTLGNIVHGTTVRISYTGYQQQDFMLENNGDSFVLKRSGNSLDSFHVRGYYQTTERFSIANVSLVDAATIGMQPVQNPLEALEGRVPGLFVTEANGLPGNTTTARIQGQNSISNGNDPLYVIDGVPFSAEFPGSTLGGPLGSSTPLSLVNPDDIESVTVLKDADATAIYGARSANGVILITTKKGGTGDARITIDVQGGCGWKARKLSLLNQRQYLEMRHEALSNDSATPGSLDYDVNGTWDTARNTNWQKRLLGGTAQFMDVNASISGGTATSQYRVSGTYNRLGSVFPGSFSNTREGVHFSLMSQTADKHFSLQLTVSDLIDDNLLPLKDVTPLALSLPPVAPAPFGPNGTLNWRAIGGQSTWENPYADLMRKYHNQANNLISNGVLSYRPAPGLQFRMNLGYFATHTNELGTTPFSSLPPETQVQGTNARIASYAYNTIKSWIVEPQANYSRGLAGGVLDILFGSTLQENTTNGLILEGRGYNSDEELPDPNSAAILRSTGSVEAVYRYASLFGRVHYRWRNKFLLNLCLRRDGSSRFGVMNEYHDFTSAGAGWIFSEEPAVQKRLHFLSFGKIRASYGTTGNDQIGDYQYSNNYTSVNAGLPYQNIPGLRVINLPNPNLQWELTRKLQAGIDVGLFNNKVWFSTTYVRNRSSDELISVNVPYVTGFPTVTENVPALVQNTELELELRVKNIKTRHFAWSSAFNFTLPHNKLVRYFESVPPYLVVGQPLNIVKAFHFWGVDPVTGVYQFLDASGHVTTAPKTPADATQYIRTGFPIWYGGFENAFHFGQLDVNVFIQCVKEIVADDQFGQTPPAGSLFNQPVYVLKRWQKMGDITGVERFSSTGLRNSLSYAQQSSGFYTDNFYARLKTLGVEWKARTSCLLKMHVREFSLYVHVQNLLTLTRFHGLDPETGEASLPLLRMVTTGIRIGL